MSLNVVFTGHSKTLESGKKNICKYFFKIIRNTGRKKNKINVSENLHITTLL